MKSFLNLFLNYLSGLLSNKPQTNLLFKIKQWLNYHYGTWFCESKSETILRDYLRKNYPSLLVSQQYRIGNFRLDFYLPDRKIAIEVDGFHHAQKYFSDRDKAKNQFLKERKIKVIRVNASDLWKKNFTLVI